MEFGGVFNFAADFAVVAGPGAIITQVVPVGETWSITDIDVDADAAQDWTLSIDGAVAFPLRQAADGHLARSFSTPIQATAGQTVTLNASAAATVAGSFRGEITTPVS